MGRKDNSQPSEPKQTIAEMIAYVIADDLKPMVNRFQTSQDTHSVLLQIHMCRQLNRLVNSLSKI